VNKPKKDHCTFFPDTVFGIYIGDGCKLHDGWYADHTKSRWAADLKLANYIKKQFKPANKPIRGFVVAVVAWLGVRFFGWYWYNK